MEFGRFQLSVHNHGNFRLDGGAMFGSVPKNLWSRKVKVDDENRICMVTRSLLIKDGERQILIDVGNGDKWTNKTMKIFAIENTPESDLGFDKKDITDIILTHLHFDHSGGMSVTNE